VKLTDFDYDLPDELIAQTPLEPRDSSRLLVVNRTNAIFEQRTFTDILEYLNPGDLLVFNDTRVIPARLIGIKPDTGAKIEVFLLNPLTDNRWEVLVRPGKKARVGTVVKFSEQFSCELVADTDFGAGKVACEVYAIGPMSAAQIERVTNFPVIVQPVFAKPIITTDSISGSQMAISANSKNPARAMKFLNLLNSDPYLHNLICFGIEGDHYTKVNDKQIHITKAGKDNYTMQVWTLGNGSINYLLDDEPINSFVRFGKW